MDWVILSQLILNDDILTRSMTSDYYLKFRRGVAVDTAGQLIPVDSRAYQSDCGLKSSMLENAKRPTHITDC